MISIVICDDDAAFAQRLKAAVETILERGKTAARVRAFSSAEEIGQETLADCDVAFFDIDFAEKSSTSSPKILSGVRFATTPSLSLSPTMWSTRRRAMSCGLFAIF